MNNLIQFNSTMNIKSLLVYPLLKAFTPLIIGGSYHILKLTSSVLRLNLNDHDDGRNQQSFDGYVSSKSGGINSEEVVTFLSEISFGIYENFFAFLLFMLLIDIICHTAQNGFEGFWRKAKSSLSKRAKKEDDGLFNVISESNLMIRIFSYTLIFVSFQIIGLCLCFAQLTIIENSQNGEISSDMKLMNLQEEALVLPRILSAEEPDQQIISTMSSDKISLSMRNILSSLPINIRAMVLSKDRKIAYTTIDSYGTLNIIDISDLKSPFIMGSLNLKNAFYGYVIKSLLLSSDERTLYASNSRELEIIDVTDPRSPKLISITESEVFTNRWQLDVSFNPRTSLAVSESTKTLYIGGLGLQIYDISNLTKPILLKVIKNSNSKIEATEAILKTEVCVSQDGKTLFMANGTLDVFDISDPREMKLVSSLTTKGDARSLLFYEESKRIFLLGTDDNKQILLEEVDISNYKNALNVQNSFQLGHKSVNSPRLLTASPSRSKFFIYANSESFGKEIKLLVFDAIKETTTEIEKNIMEETFVMNFSPDGRTLIAGSNSQFQTSELYLDYPNSRIFSENLDNQLSNFSLPQTCSNLKVSNDGKYIFVVYSTDEGDDKQAFEIWSVSNSSAPRAISSYRYSDDIDKVHFAKDYNTAYLLGDKFIVVLDISNKSAIIEKNVYKAQSEGQEFRQLVTLSDGEFGFLLMNSNRQGVLTLVNFSQSTFSGIDVSITFNKEFGQYGHSPLILRDEKTLIVLAEKILIYNISEVHSPAVKIASLHYDTNGERPDITSCTLSPDKQTLFVTIYERNGFNKLQIYNISDVASPHFISDKYLSRSAPVPRFSFPLSSESGYVSPGMSAIKLSLTNLKKPVISGVIPVENDDDNLREFVISPDGQTVYASFQNKIRIMNANVKYTLYLSKEKYLLGEIYSNHLSMLRLNGKSDYNLMNKESYKIIKLSLVDIQIAPNKASLERTVSVLPSWMTFDEESNILTMNPKRQSEIGSYTLQSAFSLKVPVDVFNGTIVAKDGKPVGSENLIAWLMSLDYLDGELFLTAKFKSIDTFYLPDQFLDYKVEIYSILKKFYMETCTMFDVISSLEFSENNLMVSSLSTSNVKAEITLQPREGSDVKFLNLPYGSLLPSVRENKTKVSLEGTMNEINTALRSVIVNFENGTSGEASIVIKDGLNPPVSIKLENISKHFKTNTAPRLNNNNTDRQTLQEQINNADVQTGKYFTYALSNDIFEDDFAESLTYEMVRANNGTAFPTWLSFSGLTLKGTPPEDIFGREIDLVLIAKNEFKQFSMPFKLQIRISTMFWLKLLQKYSPYILTAVGLLVSANKIFNIVAKRRYRHPRDYQLVVGEEVSSEVIQPILFIGEQVKQSGAILKLMKKTWRDFVDDGGSGVLNKEMITKEIKDAIQEIPFKERERINPSAVVDRIIINKLVWSQLDSDNKTKELFEQLKSKCLEVVERGSSEWVINQNELKKLLLPFINNANHDLEESLIHNIDIPGVNINLLKDAILAYAFETHSLDISPVDVDINIKQLVPSRTLFSFFKLDLRDINLNDKNKIDYGINYRIIDDKLCFYGVPRSYFQNKTLAVQIKNVRHKILKEIWIHGVSNSNLQESFVISGEQENRGQGYEIY